MQPYLGLFLYSHPIGRAIDRLNLPPERQDFHFFRSHARFIGWLAFLSILGLARKPAPLFPGQIDRSASRAFAREQ